MSEFDRGYDGGGLSDSEVYRRVEANVPHDFGPPLPMSPGERQAHRDCLVRLEYDPDEFSLEESDSHDANGIA